MKKGNKNTKKTGVYDLLGYIPGVPVLVAGDIMLDRFVYGTVDRISPESPVPVLAVTREDSMLGGAGNALANLVGLGAKASLLSVVGQDENGKALRTLVKKIGVNDTGLVTDTARPTIVKTRYLAGHQQLLRSDHESKAVLSDALSKELLRKADALLKTAKVLIISDYGKGMMSRSFLSALIKKAKAAKVTIIVDPKGHDFTIYAGADVVTPNRRELEDATRGLPTATDADVIKAASQIISECKIGAVAATRSKDGISLIQKSEKPHHFRGHNIDVYDVSGAGDTVIATIAAALAAGADLADAAYLANLAGSIAVTKVGTAPIRLQELKDAVSDDQNIFSYAEKKAPLASWDQALEQIRRWRAAGHQVGFTNGCFDILHAGHVSYLNAARGQCARLIVGLNCDASVKILKGSDRPVHDEQARAAVLAALASVDMVVLFGAEKAGQDNTARAILNVLKPDIYFKGGDYREDQIPEAPTVRAYGGVIGVMPNFAGHSTTGSIRKIKQQKR
jgi:D-beta-D-heptose 7-phosphate kinase/D-beta-D-heptose 1-phosphate adenosyltransferase